MINTNSKTSSHVLKSLTRNSRRKFLKKLGATGYLSMLGLPSLGMALSGCDQIGRSKARVIIIGAGFGGATCARYLRKLDDSLNITLIDTNAEYISCPFSNLVLAGIRGMHDLTFRYDTLQTDHDINFIHNTVINIDTDAHSIMLADDTRLEYDKLVVAPGVSLSWGSPEGYDQAASELMPHAWKAGEQTILLRKQLEAMDNGGVVAIAPPAKPFRCPPGPYERAGMIASYLSAHKPKSKILILDANENFAKQTLFIQGWKSRFPGMIEWVSVTEGGAVQRVDAKMMTLYTDLDDHKVDVANVIPAQTAGKIAVENGLADHSGWCPVNQQTFESSLISDIHVLGDAAMAGAIPKSASAANSQAKVCALAITAMLNGKEPGQPSFHNTCYSLVDADYGISVTAIYGLQDNAIQKIEGSGGVSPLGASAAFRTDEAKYAQGWFDSITTDTFG